MDQRIAVLIDADNVSEKYLKYIFDEISNHGVPTYKRIYGDWTKPQLSSWKNALLNHSITPIQQYGYTTGKNATDAALIIDAMDILYSGNVDGFCIVSSDSDFTKLSARLREAGMVVIGMGEKKTPKPFIAACEKFKYLEVLASSKEDKDDKEEREEKPEKETQKTRSRSRQPRKKQAEEPKEEPKEDAKANGIMDKKKLVQVIRNIITEISDEDGWAFLADVGNILSKRYPDFDTRNYGHAKLTPMVSSLKEFEISSRKTSNPNITHKFIRNK